MRSSIVISILLLAILFCSLPVLSAQENNSNPEKQLTPFTKLIGGEWHLGDSYQIFEWGVGKLSVNSKNYFVVEGSPKLVAEGSWFWHPGEKALKGYFTAVGMPAVLFVYTTEFETNKMINMLITYTAEGKREAYTEVWEFVDEDSYNWTLYSGDAEETKIMEGTYRRKIQNEK